MALMDIDMQRLQKALNRWMKENPYQTLDIKPFVEKGDKIRPDEQIDYFLINRINNDIVASKKTSTQAIAVAPIINGKPDFSQISIAVAGTQVGFQVTYPTHRTLPIRGHKPVLSFNDSTARVLLSTRGMSKQYGEIEAFIQESLKNAKDKAKELKLEGKTAQVRLSNLSGFSQSGPPVAKLGVIHQVDRITNFMDFGSVAA